MQTPPRVPGLPLLGTLPELLTRKLDYVSELRERHGDIFTLDLKVGEVVLLCHPRHAQHVFVDRARSYGKSGPVFDSLRTLLGNGLAMSEGDFWMRQRRMMQPAFHHQRLAALTQKMVEAIDECLEGWEAAAAAGEPFDIARAFNRVTMNVMVRTMFGAGLEPSETERVANALVYVIDFILLGFATQSLPGWVPVPGRARYREALRTIDETVFGVIERARRDTGGEATLLSLLLDMVDEESGERMSQRELRDEAVTLFLAGYETTSVTMAWAMHALTQQPHLFQRLQAEVERAVGTRVPGFADLTSLAWCRNVAQESLRLYPPVYWVARKAVEEDVIDGFRIPAGKSMAVMVHHIHRHPGEWEAPERFDPDRFTPERSAGRHKHAWVPFGAGQRQCIGKEFALMEAQLILARLAQRFHVEAVPGRVAELLLSTTLRAKSGVWVKLTRR
ncbi:cytochrome P450 [Archangium violaceum]|uniref:cytochrome P450 n=1 Tax=Archangium violaceum TaxID=83451 RepID=UPI001951E93A|nr:cytochrome P450 [Archangium violaceum]QRO02134.1 cytochrome P450 [Archangium violaceum]